MDTDYESIYALAQQIGTIERSLRAIFQNFLQPVAALPMEVLQQIFLYAIQPGEYLGHINHEYLPSSITLSQVCSAWRQAAQSYPLIWTVVRLEPCSHASYAPYARYSKGLPLEVHGRKLVNVNITGLESADTQSRITTLYLPVDLEDRLKASSSDGATFWEERGVLDWRSIERLTLLAPGSVRRSKVSSSHCLLLS
ncbi:uncharacterized protein EI90DRAFT_1907170 [Cantharellus anzutake]|uniref:uncharacterized protein n=1 Tax=Cantharellus anzutake TaxID=1750568 RepID=UPI0019075902|nr:uncharacterized protein EI90DRAFT_1907170 [Cantharellus anzutake]KAF8326551.1 hypothetical protein EI90DRAFT_1907170 [Cantharellus anzutake]